MSEAITITVGPAQYRVYQHVDAYLAQLTLSGTWDTSGTLPDAIEYRLYTGSTAGPWITPATTFIGPGGGWQVYTGSISAGPAQATGSDWYKIEVRSLANGTELAKHQWPNQFGVGYIVALAGQSNAYRWASGANSGTKTRTKATSTVEWNGSSLVWTNSNVGQGAIAFADDLASYWNTPVAMYNGAVEGAALWEKFKLSGGEWWLPDTSTTRESFRDGIQVLAGLHAIVWAQGETGALSLSTRMPHLDGMIELFRELRDEIGSPHLPVFVVQLGAILLFPSLDLWHSAIRDAHVTIDERDTFTTTSHYDLAHATNDVYHLTPAAYETLALRVGRVVKAYHLPGTPDSARGPRIRAVRYADGTKTKIDVVLDLRDGHTISPASNIKGFQLWDGTTEVTGNVTSVVKVQENQIQITLNTAVSGRGGLAYIYGTGDDGSGSNKWSTNTVVDNLGMPLEPLALPAQIQPQEP